MHRARRFQLPDRNRHRLRHRLRLRQRLRRHLKMLLLFTSSVLRLSDCRLNASSRDFSLFYYTLSKI